MQLKNIKYIIVALLLLLLTGISSFSQNGRRDRRQAVRANRQNDVEAVQAPDSLEQARLDSIAVAQDSLHFRDSVSRADSLDMLSKSSIKLPVFTSAGDSIVEDFSNGRRLIYYYGGVSVEYQDMKLSADYMEYDMATGVVYARGTLDTLTGEWKGQPEMTQGSDNYKMEELRYNFNTQKSFITNMITHDDEGILHAIEHFIKEG